MIAGQEKQNTPDVKSISERRTAALFICPASQVVSKNHSPTELEEGLREGEMGYSITVGEIKTLLSQISVQLIYRQSKHVHAGRRRRPFNAGLCSTRIKREKEGNS